MHIKKDSSCRFVHGILKFILSFTIIIFMCGGYEHTAEAARIVNITEGDEWHYFKGRTNPPYKWNYIGFDDSGWLVGSTGLGYGKTNHRTFLDDMRGNYATLHARLEFTIDNPASVTKMNLSLLCDGPFIAYLNGIEVIRNSIGPPSPGQSGCDLLAEQLDISGFAHELLFDNVLAIQCRNDDIDSENFLFLPFFEVFDSTPSNDINIVWQDNIDGNNEIYFAKKANDGSTWNSRNLTENNGNSINPRSAENGSNIYVVWQEKVKKHYDIYFMISTNGGENWEEKKRIRRSKGKLQNPAMVAEGSNIYFVWQGKINNNYEVYFKKYDGQKEKWSKKQRIYRTNGKLQNQAIAAEKSDIYLVWQSYRKQKKEKKYEIYFMHLKDKGKNVTKKKLTRLYKSKEKQKNPALAVKGLNIYVVWKGRKNKNYEIYLMSSTNRGKNWNRSMLTDKNNKGQSMNPAIAVNESGIHVVWQDDIDGNYEIYYRKYRNSVNGCGWTEPENISKNYYISQKPDIKVNGSNIQVVWQDDMDGNYEIYFTESNDGGVIWTKPENCSGNEGYSLNPVLPK